MRILFLAHFYPPEIGGAAARLHGLARWLAKDHEVTVIAGFPNYPEGVTPSEYHWRFAADEELDGVKVARCWVYATPKRGSLRRLANYFSFVFTSLIRGLFLPGKFDIVVASCPPLFIGVTGWLLSLTRRAKFVFDIRDIWPDVAVEAGEFKDDSMITRLGHALASFLYKRADHITPVTQNKLTRLTEKNVPKERLTVVSNGVDLDLVKTPDDLSTIRRELVGENKCVFLFAGLIGIAQGVEAIIEAAAKLTDQDHIQFVIVGDGVRKEAIVKLVEQYGLKNVTLLPRQPREAMPRFLSSTDVCLVPLATKQLQDAVPSKLLEAWAYSKPVILIAAGESAELVEKSRGGIVVEPGDTDAIVNAIKTMTDESAAREEMGRLGNDFVSAKLDRPILAKQMAAVFDAVLSS